MLMSPWPVRWSLPEVGGWITTQVNHADAPKSKFFPLAPAPTWNAPPTPEMFMMAPL